MNMTKAPREPDSPKNLKKLDNYSRVMGFHFLWYLITSRLKSHHFRSYVAFLKYEHVLGSLQPVFSSQSRLEFCLFLLVINIEQFIFILKGETISEITRSLLNFCFWNSKLHFMAEPVSVFFCIW